MSANFTKWDKAFSIGHEKIDSEHKKLFDIAAKLSKYKNDQKKIIEIIKELIAYTKFHFDNEEQFMESINYEDLEEHKQLHKQLIKNLSATIKEMNSLGMDEVIEKLNTLVNKNIVQHILIEDKKFHHKRKDRKELKTNFKWRSEYKVFEDLIDKEHKVLFDIALKALDYHNTDIRSHIKMTIKELYDYMKTHFKHEEEYMEKIAYTAIQEHKKLHQQIIKQINEFIKSLSTINMVDFERKLIEYIDIWLIGHIIYEDRKIIAFRNSQKKNS